MAASEEVARLYRCALSRPAATTRIVTARALRSLTPSGLSDSLNGGLGDSLTSLSSGLASLGLGLGSGTSEGGSSEGGSSESGSSSVSGSNLLEALAPLNASACAGLATTVEELRQTHGERQRWYGDLSASEARQLYHSLLPTSLLDECAPSDDEHALSVSERARIAVSARRAARLYVRERSLLHVTLGCELLDGVRQLMEHGTFQTDGPSEEQLWDKYVQRYAPLASSDADFLDGGSLHEELCYTILRKACTSNRHVDFLCGGEHSPLAAEPAVAAACEMGAAAAEQLSSS